MADIGGGGTLSSRSSRLQVIAWKLAYVVLIQLDTVDLHFILTVVLLGWPAQVGLFALGR